MPHHGPRGSGVEQTSNRYRYPGTGRLLLRLGRGFILGEITLASCGGCTNMWTAKSWAHCSVCHRTFTAVTYFDWHRAGGSCFGDVKRSLHPSHSRLIEAQGVWSTPEGHSEYLKQVAQAAKSRADRTARRNAQS